MTAEQNERLRSQRLNGDPPWIDVGKRVPQEHLLAAASMTGCTPSAVAERMVALGYRIGKVPACAEVLPGDRRLMSVDLSRWPVWLRLGKPVSRHHVLRAAVATGMTPSAVVGRLRALGYRVPDPPADSAVQRGDITLMTSHLVDGPWHGQTCLRVDWKVSPEHVLAAASVLSRTPASVVERLIALGYRVEDPGVSGELLPSDLTLLSVDLDRGRCYWLRRHPEVPVSHLLRAAVASGRTPAEVAERLRVLGYRLPEVPSDLVVTDDDKILLSRNRDGLSPWLHSGASVWEQHIRDSARILGRDRQELAARLALLGHTHIQPAD